MTAPDPWDAQVDRSQLFMLTEIAEQLRIRNLVAYLSIPSGTVEFNDHGMKALVEIEEGLGLS